MSSITPLHEHRQDPKFDTRWYYNPVQLAEAGFFPIPLCWPNNAGVCGCPKKHQDPKEVGKAPLLPGGYQHLRPTPQMVARWRSRWPRANWGLLLEPSGLLVIDGDGPEGIAEAQERGLPPTLTVARGERRHWYYRRPEDAPAARRTKAGESRQLDILAAGYVVGPGSLHRSGERYMVVEPLPIAPAPAWAVGLLRVKPTPAAVGPLPILPPPGYLNLSPRLQAVLRHGPDGDPGRYASRSEALYAVIVAAVAAGHSDAEILAALLSQAWVRDMRRHPERWIPPQIAKARATTTVRRPVRVAKVVTVGP